MKTVKIFPAPHVEVRIHVSDEMDKDLGECRGMARALGGGKDCNQCSWKDVEWLGTGLCELPAVRDRVLKQDCLEN